MASQTSSLSGCIDLGNLGTWKIQKKLSTKNRTQLDLNTGQETEARHEVYEATRDDLGPYILKVKKQFVSCSTIVPWTDPSNNSNPSDEIHQEIYNLDTLTKVNCPSTPKLLGYCIVTQGENDELPGGYVAYIIMEKVPGENLKDFDRFTEKDQNDIRIAFIDALWEFRRHHFWHHDNRRENIIWDRENNRCFMVDLEDAEHRTDLTADDVCLNPWEHLEYWQLIGEQHEDKHRLFFNKDALMNHVRTELY